MIQVKLKKLLRKRDLSSLLESFRETLNLSFFISDSQENVLWGNFHKSYDFDYPMVVDEQIVGRFQGKTDKINTVFQILNYIAHEELTQKLVVADTLERYEEIYFLYSIYHKFSKCLTFE